MIGGGGSTSVLFHRLSAAEEDSPENELFRKHIEPDIEGSTFASDRFVTLTCLSLTKGFSFSNSRKGLKHLLKMQNGALMINYESILVNKNPCDFAVAWKSGQPE